MRTYLHLSMTLLHNGDFLSVVYGALMLALPVVALGCLLSYLPRRR